MLTACRQVPKFVWVMALANLALVMAAFFSPVRIWSATVIIGLVGLGTPLSIAYHNRPSERVTVVAIAAIVYVLFGALSLFPFLVYIA